MAVALIGANRRSNNLAFHGTPRMIRLGLVAGIRPGRSENRRRRCLIMLRVAADAERARRADQPLACAVSTPALVFMCDADVQMAL
jgi:hypothetical protein